MRAFRFSLTFSILSSLACLIGLSWVLLSIISFKTAEQDLLAQKVEEGRILLASFNGILPPDLRALSGSQPLKSLMNVLSAERSFHGVTVIGRDGRVVYSFMERTGPDERLHETIRTGGETFLLTAGGVLSRYAPVTSDGEIVGATRLTLSLAGEYERLKKSRQLFFAYFVLDFLLLMTFGSWLLSRIVVVPVKRLLTATERVAAGEYGHAVHVPGSAEIAELAESFGQMQEALRKKQHEADSYVKSLEQANMDLQAAREESIRSEKMASVGLLAAGMAHEIGTPLSTIIGYVGLMQDEVRENPAQSDYLRRMELEAGKIDRLIRGLLDYARPAAFHPEAVDMLQLVRECLEIFELRSAAGIRTIVDSEENVPPADVDRNLMQQVLMNLFLNARDAMPHGGDLKVSLSFARFRLNRRKSGPGSGGRRAEDKERALVAPAPGEEVETPCVVIIVSDTGEGIPVDHLPRIFDPFFTTKEPGKGTGLGLAISARIIDTFGGRITVEKIDAGGTAFTVLLPSAQLEHRT